MGNPAIKKTDDQVRQAPTVAQAARRLLDALDRLTDGCDVPGFAGWENGHGESVGDEAEAARHELAAVLAMPQAEPSRDPCLTAGGELGEEFEAVYRSAEVQTAGQSYGWRGIAEAVWRAAKGAKA